jgi:hypothetical protein
MFPKSLDKSVNWNNCMCIYGQCSSPDTCNGIFLFISTYVQNMCDLTWPVFKSRHLHWDISLYHYVQNICDLTWPVFKSRHMHWDISLYQYVQNMCNLTWPVFKSRHMHWDISLYHYVQDICDLTLYVTDKCFVTNAERVNLKLRNTNLEYHCV